MNIEVLYIHDIMNEVRYTELLEKGLSSVFPAFQKTLRVSDHYLQPLGVVQGFSGLKTEFEGSCKSETPLKNPKGLQIRANP
jgi:hypothetical protein